MAADQRVLGLYRPVSMLGMQIGMANASAFDLDKTLPRCKLGRLDDRTVLLDFETCPDVGYDCRNLGFRDLMSHVVVCTGIAFQLSKRKYDKPRLGIACPYRGEDDVMVED
jgi:hypothetical protein